MINFHKELGIPNGAPNCSLLTWYILVIDFLYVSAFVFSGLNTDLEKNPVWMYFFWSLQNSFIFSREMTGERDYVYGYLW